MQLARDTHGHRRTERHRQRTFNFWASRSDRYSAERTAKMRAARSDRSRIEMYEIGG